MRENGRIDERILWRKVVLALVLRSGRQYGRFERDYVGCLDEPDAYLFQAPDFLVSGSRAVTPAPSRSL